MPFLRWLRLLSWMASLAVLMNTSAVLAQSPASVPVLAPAFQSLTSAVAGEWAELFVGGRAQHTVIYDPLRERMIVFGGSDGATYRNTVWALSLADPPVWTCLRPSGTLPAGLYGHSAIYDPLRDRMLVFGGSGNAGSTNAVWALALDGSPAWTLLSPAGTPPNPCSGHVAVYDPARDAMLVFGGSIASNFVWRLSLSGTPAWSPLAPTGTAPAAGSALGALYDPVRNRLVIYGGSGATTALTLAGTPNWQPVLAAGTPPDAASGSGVIYDPVRDRMVVFSGSGAIDSSAAWALSLSGTPAWNRFYPAGTAPSRRMSPRGVYDPVHDRLVEFGGSRAVPGGPIGPVGDSWALSLGDSPAWAQLAPDGPPPSGRSGHAAIYDPVRARMLVFGGYWAYSYGGADHYLNDVWALSLSGIPSWTQLAPAGAPPIARVAHSAIYDPVRDRMVIFGGWSATTAFNDAWALTLSGTPTWTRLAPLGAPPSARGGQGAIYDPRSDGMVLFGGVDSLDFRNDVWTLQLADPPAWSPGATTGEAPTPRWMASATYDPTRERMVVFAGVGSSWIRSSEVSSLSLAATPNWSVEGPVGLPPARERHSAIYDPTRDRMVIFGGYGNYGAAYDDVWALSLAGSPAWAQLSPPGPGPGGRQWQTAIYDPGRDRMLVYGGSPEPAANMTYTLTWTPLAGAAVPPAWPFATGLSAPAPNPFSGSTPVTYTLPRAGRASVGVYDVNGRLVRTLLDAVRSAGPGAVTWNGNTDARSRPAAGVYFVRVLAPGLRETRRVVLLR